MQKHQLDEIAKSREDKRRIELRHMRYFVALAEELNFGRAAQRLNMAQPPLSQQIKQLETWLKARLCDRTSRGVVLTPAGHAFLGHARRVLREIEFGVQMTREIESGMRGQLRMAAVYSAMYSVMPGLVRMLHRRLPNVVLSLREMTVNDQMVALQNGDIEVGVVRMPLPDSSVKTRVLVEERLVTAMPFDHPLASKDQVRLEELLGQPLLLAGVGLHRNYQFMVLKIFTDRGLVPDIAQETPDMHSMIGLISAGLGIGIIPESLQQVKLENVVYRQIADDLPRTSLALAWSPEYETGLFERFLEVVDEYLADNRNEGDGQD